MRRFSMTAGFARAMVLSMATCLASSASASDKGQFWRALQSGEAFAIMRHALAPGIGDPAIFDPEDCATQRNLSEEGRQQARELGETFRRNGITQAEVYSSVWCRCTETAELLGLGPVTTLPALNSFFETRSRREMQTDALERWLADREEGAPLVLVTHQVNISALLGVFTSSGETLVVRREDDGDFEVIGSF